VPGAIYTLRGILMKDAVLVVLLPGRVLHRIRVFSYELQHTDAVEGSIDSGSGVEHEILTGLWVDELFRTFVGR
jgi:hypothetical protein